MRPKKKKDGSGINSNNIGEQMNPHFLRHLESMERDARNAGNEKLAFSFTKAIKSLRRYPLPLASGQEAKQLEGIGPFIATKLDQFLEKNPEIKQQIILMKQQYCPGFSADSSQQSQSSEDGASTGKSKKKTTASSKRKKSNNNSNGDEDDDDDDGEHTALRTKKASRYESEGSQSNGAEDDVGNGDYNDNDDRGSGKPTGGKKERKYVPKYRGAAWAILIALYKASLPPSLTQSMSKDQLISAAEPFSDTPMMPQFTGTSASARYYYSGWSSVATLQKKDLIDKKGRPMQLFLTAKGKELAKELYETYTKMGGPSMGTPTQPKTRRIEHSDDVNNGNSNNDRVQRPVSRVLDMNSEIPSISSVQKINETSARKEEKAPLHIAEPTTRSDDHSDLIVLEDDDDDNDCGEGGTLSNNNDDNSSGHGYFDTDPAPTLPPTPAQGAQVVLGANYLDSNGLPTTEKDSASIVIEGESVRYKIQIMLTRQDLLNIGLFENARISVDPDSKTKALLSSIDSSDVVSVHAWVGDELATNRSSGLKSALNNMIRSARARRSNTSATAISAGRSQPQSQPNARNGTTNGGASSLTDATKRTKDNTSRAQSSQQQETSGVSSITRRSGSKFSEEFDVVLVVDQRERVKGDRKFIQETLAKKGVACEVRSLDLGDAIWIARRKTPTQRYENNNDEFVLNFIVERKAVDDLASSIMDGRYAEQKSRLMRSNIENVIYIVEGDLKTNQTKLPYSTLQSALVSTQLNNGITVKQTSNVEETIHFLRTFTREITRMIDSGELTNYALVTSLTGSNHKTPVTLSQFNREMGMNRNLDVKEIFVRQLCLIRGCTREKAEAIVERYPTPRALIEGVYLDPALSEETKKTLLRDLEYGDQQRHLSFRKKEIGDSISTFLFRLYTSDSYPSFAQE